MQLFLKNFISPLSPYNNLLIYHKTGTGKTCTMITIIEQFKKYIKNLRNNLELDYTNNDNYSNIKINNKRIHIIIPKGFTKEKYLKELHNTESDINQCTSLEYYNHKEIAGNYERFLYGDKKKIGRLTNIYKLSNIEIDWQPLSVSDFLSPQSPGVGLGFFNDNGKQ